MRVRIALFVICALAAVGCRTEPPAETASVEPASAPDAWFVDRAEAAGLTFTHVNGMSGRLYYAEIIPPGAALFDYDNDGDLDVYLVQGQTLEGGLAAGPEGRTLPTPAGNRLFRNELAGGLLRFTDVTALSGIVARGYGMGVAAGDFDNDGWVDLYLTKFAAPNQLLRNNGNGTFADVSRESGTDHQSWSASAAFVDVDRDGWLDLYVTNYLRYSLQDTAPCFSAAGALDYCTPDAYPPLPDRLYMNRRNGRFDDASGPSGIAREFGPGLGVSTADFNGDGWIDIYVANDGRENQLWLNRRDGSLENAALLSGVALPVTGKAEASMGVDAGDFDDDGDEDLFVTELTGEGSNLFVNDGTGTFEDRSAPAGVGPASLPFTGFGVAWLDYDNDGQLDLLSVNGTVQIIESLRQARDPFPLHQRRLLMRGVGAGRFEDVSLRAGAAFAQSEVGRGTAFGDVDNDGDTDVLVGNNHGPVRLLINEAAAGRHWIGLDLRGTGGRAMLGARVEIVRPGAASRWRRARADGSYASACDPRVLVGLGDSTAPPGVRVIWPSGKTESWDAVPIDRYTRLTEGAGK